MKKIIVLLWIVAMTTPMLMADVLKLDHRFLKNSANKVWAMDLPQFNPAVELTDTVFTDASGVAIAKYYYIRAERSRVDEIGNMTVSATSFLGETALTTLRRTMVKINDAKALEHLTEFTFDPSEQIRSGGIVVYTEENAFGARIIKPDGSVVDVDMKATVTESSGKKGNKAVEHKIAIPGLETGDILDYFYYSEITMLGNQSHTEVMEVMSDFPVASFVVRVESNTELTTEINTFNGVEEPVDLGIMATFHEGKLAVRQWEFNNLKSFHKPSYSCFARQFPFMRVKISDNLSKLFRSRKSYRPSGVFVNLVTPVILSEIAEVFTEIEIEPKDLRDAEDIVKDYRKRNPELTDGQIADAVWKAVLYVSYFSKEKYDEWLMLALFKDVMDKQNLATDVKFAVSAPRNSISIEQIAGYGQVEPMVLVGDKVYVLSRSYIISPGELPALFAGEPYYTLEGKRKNIYDKKQFFISRFPKDNFGSNSVVIDANLRIPDVEGDSISYSYEAVRKGDKKDIGSLLTPMSLSVASIEKILDIPAKLRKKHNFDRAKIEEQQKKIMEVMPKIDLNLDKATVDSARVISDGFSTEDISVKYKVSGSAGEIVAPAGDDIIVNIGKLVEVVSYEEKDEDKKREMSIFTSGPYSTRVNLILEVPEGYYADPEAVAQLNANVNNVCGNFFAQSRINPDTGNIELRVNFRNKNQIFGPDQWNDFIALRKACSDFSSNSIIFHKK